MRAAHPSFYLYYRKSCTIAKLTDTSSDALPCRHVPRWFNGLPCLHFDPQVLYLWLWLFSWLLQPRTLAEPLQSQLSSASLCPRPHFSYLSYRIKYRWWNKSMNTTFSPLNHKTVFPILKTHPHEVVNLKKKNKNKKMYFKHFKLPFDLIWRLLWGPGQKFPLWSWKLGIGRIWRLLIPMTCKTSRASYEPNT